MLALMGQLAQERWINSKTADRKCALGLRASRLLHCVYLCDMLLSPPPLFLTQACSKPGPVPDCIWLVIISSQLGSSGAPAALMKQSRLASLHLTSTRPPLVSPSQNKFNLEVPRTDKTRSQHKGQRGRGVTWYLLPTLFTSYTHTHILFFSTPTHPPRTHLSYPQTKTSHHLFCLQKDDRINTGSKMMSNAMLWVHFLWSSV